MVSKLWTILSFQGADNKIPRLFQPRRLNFPDFIPTNSPTVFCTEEKAQIVHNKVSGYYTEIPAEQIKATQLKITHRYST